MFWIGIDGGGTKTLLRMELDGRKLSFQSGSMNSNGVGLQAAEENLRSILSEAMEAAGGRSPDGICVGTAGYSNDRQREMVRSVVRQAGIEEKRLILTDDGEIALEGALGNQAGMILIAGTGSICYGRASDGTIIRTGGYGHILDDGGSGYAAGRDILSTVVRYLDGRGSVAPVLTELTAQKLGAEKGSPEQILEKIVSFVYAPERAKADIADFAKFLDPAVEAGDPAAMKIARRAAEELMILLQAAEKKIEKKNRIYGKIREKGITDRRLPVCLLGGFLLKTKSVREEFSRRACDSGNPEFRLCPPHCDAAEGALLLAKKGK